MAESDGFAHLDHTSRNPLIGNALQKIKSNASKSDRERLPPTQRERSANHAHYWPSGPPEPYLSFEPVQEDTDKIWREIEAKKAHHSADFVRVYCAWARPPTLDNVLYWRRQWTSSEYGFAYPHFSLFLKGADRANQSRCTILIEDTNAVSRKKERYLFRDFAYDHLWDSIKKRPLWAPASMHEDGVQDITTASVRLIQITDLSPMVLACILGSTPKLDVSNVTNFMDRHLKLKNFGKVNLLTFHNMGWSSYTLEYHFTFYYVSTEYTDPEEVRRDPRSWRRTAPFGRERAGTIRHIHEETISMLLINHLDICTCLQLNEAYWKDPYAKDLGNRTFRPFDPAQPHSMLFLSWIAVALHHVSWRWENAIAAVDSEVMTPAQVVFTSDRDVLMTDDPQFSHAKTYYWALQSYKLFEQKLVTTIETWRHFKKDSLNKLWHNGLDREEWFHKERSIDFGIQQLESKVERIRERINEVRDLREGLASASALFDSRTTIRQGDNIRLLTYVNLLFLPLTFGTSIFGMQIMGNGTRVVHAFAIALPCSTLLTFFIIINLDSILQIWNTVTEKTSYKLRDHMRHHRRRDWKHRAIAINEAKTAQRAVPRARRPPGGWVYLFFMLESIYVGIPAHEVLAAQRWFIAFLENIGLRTLSPERSVERGKEVDLSLNAPRNLKKLIVRERARRLRDKAEKTARRQRQDWRKTAVRLALVPLNFAVIFFRILAFPFLAGILLLEYLLLVVYLAITTPPQATQYEALPDTLNRIGSEKSSTQPLTNSYWLRAIHTLGLDDLLPEQPSEDTTGATADSSENMRPGKILRKATTFAQSGSLGSSGGIENIIKQRKSSNATTAKIKRANRISQGGLIPVREDNEGSSIRESSPARLSKKSTTETLRSIQPTSKTSTAETQHEAGPVS